MKNNRSIQARRHIRESGFSLVELMIGSAIGLIILAALSYVLVSNIQSRNELEKGSRQLESGRFALSTLSEDIQLAGFYGEYFPAVTGITTPDPCTLVLQDMQFADAGYSWNTGNPAKLPAAIYGFGSAEAVSTACTSLMAKRKTNTSVLVVRRASTVPIVIDTDGNNSADTNVTMEDGSTATYASLAKGYYVQASNCSEISAAAEYAFIMDHDTSKFGLHKAKRAGTPPLCTTGTLSDVRRYIVRIFFISTCNDCSGSGDGIPTLKMLELTPQSTACTADTTSACGSFEERAIADGIEELRFEYGIDNSPSGGDGVPDEFVKTPTSAQWQDVVAVKVFLLARNVEKTPGYNNNKTYVLSTDGTVTVAPNDDFKRHLYSATVRAANLSGRRQ